ncbi:MAG: bifunctional riboflavin kinase/FAD synthetase [Dehalococcoidia bacterium]|jgi:riboflavin kinase/FMN adenylyltransferase|nr:bifunctional riboflavin kinase/FAD synthetase [Dehalococcoidia bacterium]
MLIEEELTRYREERDTLLSIGVFDGVHLGHRHLLGHLRDQALAAGLMPGVVTFVHHPRQVLYPESGVTYLMPIEERLELLRDVGMEVVAAVSFTQELSSLDAGQFLSLLQRYLRLKGLVIGPDFALGRGRGGDAAHLSALSQSMGLSLERVPQAAINGDVVSSTAIRTALGKGDVDLVSRLLGRNFSLSGQVVGGEERGRILGFPTANISFPPNQALPADGVYATSAIVGGRPHSSVTNIGIRPTFNTGQRTVETFLLDFKGDLYGQVLTIKLVARLREEKRFESVSQLVAQMERDILLARSLLTVEKEPGTEKIKAP